MTSEGRKVARAVAITLAIVGGAVLAVGLARAGGAPSLPVVAYSVETDLRQYDIAVSSGGESQLVTHDKLSFYPSWSPNGSQIAFLRGEPGSWEETQGYREVRVWVMEPDGSNARAVSPIVDTYGPPQWEPNGESLILPVGRCRQRALMHLDVTTGEMKTALAPFSGDSWEISLSPDGTSVLSDQGDPDEPTITLLTDGTVRAATQGVLRATYESMWSPDGHWIVTNGRARGEGGGIWAYNLQDGRVILVSRSQGTDYAWSSGDELLICRSIGIAGELWLIDIGDGGVGERVNDDIDYLGNAHSTGDCLGGNMDVRVQGRY